MAGSTTFEPEKAAHLIAYIRSRGNVGKVKLMKLLYLTDFIAYAETGNAITNDTYEHWRMGPVPVSIFKSYESVAQCACATLPGFSPEERALVDKVLEQYGAMSKEDLVNMVHKEVPYSMTKSLETIPYYLAAYRSDWKLSQSELTALRSDDDFIGKALHSYATAVYPGS